MNVLWAGSLSRLSTSKLFFTRMPKVDINDTPACMCLLLHHIWATGPSSCSGSPAVSTSGRLLDLLFIL